MVDLTTYQYYVGETWHGPRPTGESIPRIRQPGPLESGFLSEVSVWTPMGHLGGRFHHVSGPR